MQEAQDRARIHLDFSVKVYRAQMRAGRYFVHEHPQSATSWKVDSIEKLSESPMVLKAYANMCAFGMTSKDKEGEAPVLKPTVFMTNSVEIKNELAQKCRGCKRHVHLMEGRASAAQVYPPELCRAVCRGIVNQARVDASELFSMKSIGGEADINAMMEINAVEHEDNDWRRYWDDTSGQPLDWELTTAARKEEIECIHTMGVYKKVPIDQCLKRTGRRPIGTRWVDVNKGDSTNPKHRSRLVAQELNVSKMPELFAATPPIEYIRYLVSCCASSQWSSKPTRIMIQDVKKAYFFAPARREVYVALPWEDKLEGEENMCALLLKSLYGTRDAATNWADAYTEVLIKLGFTKGESSPCTFYHAEKGIQTVVHGDDFVSEGEKGQLLWLDKQMKLSFELKTEILGPDKGETREVRILNRVLRWEDAGISWEADQRHAELIIEQLDLKDAKPVTSPGCKEEERRATVTEAKRARMLEGNAIDEFVDDKWQRRRASQNDIDQVMEADGWSRIGERGWAKNFESARSMIEAPIGIMKRRTTWKEDGSLMEDLQVNGLTSDRLLRRHLRRPENIEVEMELSSVEDESIEWNDQPMTPKEMSSYRAIVARVNFLSQDRSELLFASKECSRYMSAPCNGDWAPLKRIGKFLKGTPRLVTLYEWQDMPTGFDCFTDSNWAGCRATRKSTSGAAFMHGKHLLKSYSRTQSNIALSSAEAELYATVVGASEGLGFKAMGKDFGKSLEVRIHVDASAAIGIAQRKGLGKLRHLDTQALWIQDALRTRRVNVEKVLGTENPADLMTKHLGGPDLQKCLKKLGIQIRHGRADAAPSLVKKAEANALQATDIPVHLNRQVTADKVGQSSTPATDTTIGILTKGSCWADEDV